MRICRVCFASEDKVEFKPRANLCVDCNKEYMAKYRRRNRERLSQQVLAWKHINHEHFRASERAHYATPKGKAMHIARVQRTPRTWLGKILSHSRKKCKDPGPHDAKSGPQRDFEITLDYIMELWESQAGRCILTHIPMTHEFNNPHSASIDRKDSSLGYVPGNVQLVCQWVNRAKHTMSNAEFLAIMDMVAENRDIR